MSRMIHYYFRTKPFFESTISEKTMHIYMAYIWETMHLKVHGFLQMQVHNHMLLYEDKQILAKTMHLRGAWFSTSLAFLATTRILYTNSKNTS